jgi:hypothetical protein
VEGNETENRKQKTDKRGKTEEWTKDGSAKLLTSDRDFRDHFAKPLIFQHPPSSWNVYI